MQCAAPPSAQPVTTEFIPLKKDCDDTEDEGAKKKDNTEDESLGTLDLQLCTFDSSNPSTDLPFDPRQDVKAENKVAKA